MNIKFNYQVNRTANLFHFISNLTDWHFSTRKNYREKWLKQTSDLTTQENKYLSEISDLFRKYPFGENYWGKIFLVISDDKVWDKAEEKFGEDNQKFKDLSEKFDKRFDLIWEGEENKLLSWKDFLFKTEKDFVNEDLLKDLNILFATVPKVRQQIQVNLLLGGLGGGAGTTDYSIEMELSDVALADVKRVWAVIWHELIHKFWETYEYKNMVRNFSQNIKEDLVKGVPNHIVFKEMVASALFPWGYFRKKYFKTDTDSYIKQILTNVEAKEEKGLPYFRFLSASKMAPLVEEYVKKDMSIDKAFLEKIKLLIV